MRAELRRIESDAGHPFVHEPSVLPCGQAASIAATGKQKLASLPAGQSQVFVDRLARLVGELEANWPTGLFLADGRPVHRVPAWRHIIDAHGDHVASAQFTVDRQVEESKVARLPSMWSFVRIDH